MNDRINQMAIEAGFTVQSDEWLFAEMLGRFAKLVAEDCAKVCEDVDMFNYDDPGSTYARAIRARYGLT